MADDSTRTGFGLGYGNDNTKTTTNKKIQVRMTSGKIYGPYTRPEIFVFIAEKRIQGEEFMLIEGDTEWRPISSDNEFFDALQAVMFGTQLGTKKPAGFSEDKAKSTGSVSLASSSIAPKTPPTPRPRDTKVTNFTEKSSATSPRPKVPTPKEKSRTGSTVTPAPTKSGVAPPATRVGLTSNVESPQTQAQTGRTQWGAPVSVIGQPPAAPVATPKSHRTRTVLIAAVTALVICGAYFLTLGSGANVNAPRTFGMFGGQLWYSRPLQLVMEGLQINASPLPENIEASDDWGLVEDFGAQAWAEDLKKLIVSDDASYRIKSAYWGRWAWNTLWLGSVIRVFDAKLGESLFKDGLNVYHALVERKLVTPQHQAMFDGATLFIEAKFKDAAAKFSDAGEIELAQWLAEESAWLAFWQAGARGSGYRRLRDEYRSPTLDLSSKVRATFMTREAKDFNESLLQLANQAPLLNTLWFGAAEANWRLRKDGTSFANKMFLTGLGAVALNPGSVQSVYWAQFAEFLGVFGRQATSLKARANLAAIDAGGIERKRDSWWDLNAAELDVTTLAEEVLASSSRANLNPRDMATLYVLGFVAPNGSKFLTVAAEHWAFEGKWTKANALFEKVSKIDPKSARALGGMVWASTNLYQFGEAFDAHDKLTELRLPKPEDKKYMGVIQSIGREYENAENSFSEYIKEAPNDGWAHYFQGENRLRQEKNVDCVKSGQLARVHGEGELKLRANLLFYRCRVLAGMDVKTALKDLEQMARANPESVPIAIEYVQALRNADLYDQALEFNREMLAKFSRSFELRMQLGKLYESKNDYDRAVAFYSRARQDQPESAEPVVRTARIFEMQRKFPQAAQNYETASRIQPDYPEVWLFAARAYRKARQPEVAAKMYFQEIEARPAVIASFIEAAEFFLEINAPGEVPKLFQKFQDDFQNDPRVKTRLAQAYLALNELDKAQENAAAAMAANNKIPETYRVLGYVYDQQAQYEEAGKYFQTYLQLLPQAADAGEISQKINNPPYR